MAKRTVRTTVGILGLLAVSLASAPGASAQPVDGVCGIANATLIAVGQITEFEGTEGDDVIIVNTVEEVTVTAMGGDDIICAFSAARIHGGDGNDTIFGSDERDRLEGDAGDDVIHGGAGPDVILAGRGNDTVFGNQGADQISGTDGNDILHGGLGNDSIGGGDGDDAIFGGPGDDLIYGMNGRDDLFGGAGSDVLFSRVEVGSQFLLASPFQNLGINAISEFEDSAGSRMQGGPGNDLLVGSNRWDRMLGGDGDDWLFGLEGRDWMRGGAGNDVILGGAGIDDINGNLGRDELVIVGADIGRGGFGEDTCVNGPGSASSPVVCELSTTPGPEYNDLVGRVQQTLG